MMAALAALFLLVFAASAMRHFVPGLKQATRASALTMRVTRSPSDQGKRAMRLRSFGGGMTPGLAKRIVLAVRRLLPRPRLSFRKIAAPDSRPYGAEALGTSLPRRLRWKALGGHGRNGPGAGI